MVNVPEPGTASDGDHLPHLVGLKACGAFTTRRMIRRGSGRARESPATGEDYDLAVAQQIAVASRQADSDPRAGCSVGVSCYTLAHVGGRVGPVLLACTHRRPPEEDLRGTGPLWTRGQGEMMAHALTVGVDVGIYGRLARRDHILELAELAESSGVESIWVADHVIFPTTFASTYPYSATGAFPVDMTHEPLLEPMATMGVLVGATRRVKIGTAVLVMPYRNPVLLARMLVTLDVLSGGRTVLGAGVGWLAEEFTALDARPFAARGRVTDECLEIVKRLCQGGDVTFQGEYYQLDPVVSSPGSVQRPHPPILIGGTSNAALRRAVRLGDGWLSTGLCPERLRERVRTLQQLCEAQGRRFADLSLSHKLFINIGEARTGADGGRDAGTGSQAEIVDDLRRLVDLGYRRVIVRYRGSDAAEQRTQLHLFIANIIPKV
jgi:probable F420-dependent oxidoreductase